MDTKSLEGLRLLVLGAGDTGQRVATLARELSVTVLTARRTPGKGDVAVDVRDRERLRDIARTFGPTHVLYCVAAGGREHYDVAYNEGVRNATEVAGGAHFCFVSSTSVYPKECGTQSFVDEDSFRVSASEPFQKFESSPIAKGEWWTDCVGGMVARAAGIYGPGRDFLLRLVKEWNGEPLNNRMTNRIHVHDLARALVHLFLQEECGGTFNITDGHPARLDEVLSFLASDLQLPAPRFAETVEGRIVLAEKLQAMGFVPAFPSYREGYRAM